MSDTEVRNRKVNRAKSKGKKAKDEPVAEPVLPKERDEGDGESIPEEQPDEFGGSSAAAAAAAAAAPASVVQGKTKSDAGGRSGGGWRRWAVPLALLAAAAATRFHDLDTPRNIVFDELHYGRYAGLYLKRTFFFDSHPPLGKQLLAAAGYLAGFQGDFKFDKIGSAYNASVPVYAMRSVPAAMGSALIPLVYLIVLQLGFSQWTAGLAAFLFLFDNALVTQSHYMLMEPILLFFALTGLLCTLKFRAMERGADAKGHAYTARWWAWLLSAGFFLTCSFCVKYVGMYSYGLGCALIGYDFWETRLGDRSLTKRQVLGHAAARLLALVAVPVAVYVAVFYVHLTTLVNAGPHDSAMSSGFQASLEGGLASILRGQPLEVLHGSQVTLRHTHGVPCWLHSHESKYPVKYADKRGSSHQQQVTCYHHKDVNNWWIVKRPNRTDVVVAAPYDRIRHGDVVQMVHGITGRNLNTHNVAAPVSPTKQEVSCYMDHNVSMPAQDLWRVDIVNRAEVGDIWHALESEVRLIHVNTSAALAFTGRVLPEWGHQQYEIAADIMVVQDNTIFNVEEHRHTKSEEEKDRQLELHHSEFIPLEPPKYTFFQKFMELQIRMLFISNENVQNHMYTSSPWDWLLLTRGIAYWVASDSNAQIHLLGNVLIWYSATLALAAYSALLVLYLLRRRRQCFDIDDAEWRQFRTTGEVLLLGYAFHFVPYFFVEHTLFLHHYLPALAFQLLLTAAVVEHAHYLTRLLLAKPWARRVFQAAVLVWMAAVLAVFQAFLPLCYGTGPLSAQNVLDLKLRETWDFIIHKP